MMPKKANFAVRCNVNSCAYHCGDQSYCSLNAIQVDACENCGSGCPADESMCASYKRK